MSSLSPPVSFQRGSGDASCAERRPLASVESQSVARGVLHGGSDSEGGRVDSGRCRRVDVGRSGGGSGTGTRCGAEGQGSCGREEGKKYRNCFYKINSNHLLLLYLQRDPIRTVREWDVGKREQPTEDGEGGRGAGKGGREGSQEGGRGTGKEADRKRGSLSPGELSRRVSSPSRLRRIDK